jgi:hypothetical protein
MKGQARSNASVTPVAEVARQRSGLSQACCYNLLFRSTLTI